MKKLIQSSLPILWLMWVTPSHAELSFEQQLQQGCAKIKSYAATGQKFYQQQQYKKALDQFNHQAAWTEFCASNANLSGVKIGPKDFEIAQNNVGLSYAKLGQPLWAKVWFQLDPTSKISQFNLKQLAAPPISSDFSGQYVNYAGYGAWNSITVRKKNQHYQIQYDGLYMGIRSLIYGPNTGEFNLSIPINTLQARYKYEDCSIDLKFKSNSQYGQFIEVKQDSRNSFCGFGHNVNAAGIYQKVEHAP